jgi:hypothetical protein
MTSLMITDRSAALLNFLKGALFFQKTEVADPLIAHHNDYPSQSRGADNPVVFNIEHRPG